MLNLHTQNYSSIMKQQQLEFETLLLVENLKSNYWLLFIMAKNV